MYRIPPWLVHVLWGESEAGDVEYWCISWRRRSFIPVAVKYLISLWHLVSCVALVMMVHIE